MKIKNTSKKKQNVKITKNLTDLHEKARPGAASPIVIQVNLPNSDFKSLPEWKQEIENERPANQFRFSKLDAG